MSHPTPAARWDLAKDGLSAVVVGYDGSGPARGAMAMAMGLARRDQAYLWVCFVGELPALTGVSAQVAGPAAVTLQDAYGEICEQVGGYLTEFGIRGECVRRDGDPAHALERLAEEVRADLIVVGRSSGRAHAVIGSVAVSLVRKAHRPVVVVP